MTLFFEKHNGTKNYSLNNNLHEIKTNTYSCNVILFLCIEKNVFELHKHYHGLCVILFDIYIYISS